VRPSQSSSLLGGAVTLVSVEAGRDQEQIGPELAQNRQGHVAVQPDQVLVRRLVRQGQVQRVAQPLAAAPLAMRARAGI
jgi:hypothetical protein